jgi:hypothetical protein
MRRLPGVVIRSLPTISAIYPSAMSRALCSVGITAGGSNTAHLPTVSSEANSSRVGILDFEAMIRIWPRSKIKNVQFCSDQAEKREYRPSDCRVRHDLHAHRHRMVKKLKRQEAWAVSAFGVASPVVRYSFATINGAHRGLDGRGDSWIWRASWPTSRGRWTKSCRRETNIWLPKTAS